MLKGKSTGKDLDRQLYLARKLIETEVAAKYGNVDECYICTMSSRTIVYKGMLRSVVVPQFYLDLQNPLFETRFVIYHRRFSTNTTPKWPLAQPMRFLGLNGEINTHAPGQPQLDDEQRAALGAPRVGRQPGQAPSDLQPRRI